MGCARFPTPNLAPIREVSLWRISFTGRTWPCSRNVSLNRTRDAEREVLLSCWRMRRRKNRCRKIAFSSRNDLHRGTAAQEA